MSKQIVQKHASSPWIPILRSPQLKRSRQSSRQSSPSRTSPHGQQNNRLLKRRRKTPQKNAVQTDIRAFFRVCRKTKKKQAPTPIPTITLPDQFKTTMDPEQRARWRRLQEREDEGDEDSMSESLDSLPEERAVVRGHRVPLCIEPVEKEFKEKEREQEGRGTDDETEQKEIREKEGNGQNSVHDDVATPVDMDHMDDSLDSLRSAIGAMIEAENRTSRSYSSTSTSSDVSISSPQSNHNNGAFVTCAYQLSSQHSSVSSISSPISPTYQPDSVSQSY